MGGKVLDYEAKRILKEGKEEGRIEGKIEGVLSAISRMVKIGIDIDVIKSMGYTEEQIEKANELSDKEFERE